MTNIIRILTLLVWLSSIVEMFPISQPSAYAGQPEYAKWGRIAMQQTASRYHGNIVDYLHVGRTQVSPGVAEETFKFWLRNGTREYGVRVVIRFYTANDQIITVTFQETTN